jgi:hypothetical protein
MPALPLADVLGLSNETMEKIAWSVVLPIVTTIVSFFVGRWWGNYRARRQWERKDFLGRIIVSVNMLQENRLRIRTIMERTLEEMFPNALVVEKVRDAALRTAADNPMMPIDKKDCWYLLNFVLNSVAEHFVQGVIKMDAGVPVTKTVYGLFLTCEQVGEERIRKVRAMLLKKEFLENFPYPDTMPELENSWHADRIVTLRRAAAAYKSNPELFLFLEVCV